MSEIVNTYRYVQINAHTQTYTDIVHPDIGTLMQIKLIL